MGACSQKPCLGSYPESFWPGSASPSAVPMAMDGLWPACQSASDGHALIPFAVVAVLFDRPCCLAAFLPSALMSVPSLAALSEVLPGPFSGSNRPPFPANVGQSQLLVPVVPGSGWQPLPALDIVHVLDRFLLYKPAILHLQALSPARVSFSDPSWSSRPSVAASGTSVPSDVSVASLPATRRT